MKKEKFISIVEYIKNHIANTELENHVYVVGGCVRDYIMNNDINDIDIAVDIPDGGSKLGEYMMRQNLLARNCISFPAYSVCQFVLKEYPDVEIEAVQTRKESYLDPSSRNPVTAFGSIEEDCYRRDLTINSLYMNVSTGEILDITGRGLKDIENKIIGTPLDPRETFEDDPLRMLRVIRFASRFNFRIYYDIFEAIKDKKERLKIISAERIKEELCKMIKDKNIIEACFCLNQTGILNVIFPELNTYEWTIGSFHHSIYKLNRFGLETKLAYMLLCAYEEESDAMAFLRKLKFSNAEIKFIMKIFTTVCRFFENYKKRKVDSADLYRECHLAGDYDFLEKCIWVFYGLCDNSERYYGDSLYSAAIDCVTETGTINFFNFELPLNGDDIMKEFNISPGPEVKVIQEEMLNWILKHPFYEVCDLISYIKDML